jgi:hypothetical protein
VRRARSRAGHDPPGSASTSTPRGGAGDLNNWRKHKEDRVPATKRWVLDPYSTAQSFLGWIERIECIERGDAERWLARALSPLPDDLEALPTSTPQSWLLREGWKLGGQVSVFEAPKSRPRA